MPKRSRKPPRQKDTNELARQVVDAIPPRNAAKKPAKKKDPAAVALGRRGGLKGGPARAAKMTAEERAESARAAALARWRTPPPGI